ncbi:VOC family protein [Herbaspirillum autotrophicum]|uniref:VOC family protein n=1 Tax=Herbaspirillum autotrophicum TaxID=180195 RepID=UPI00067BB77A|nr:VOC family protein [Herbaspirillum autotrophicum]
MHAAHPDHLVVTAFTLADGVAWVERTLGVSLQNGGEHVRMGTHNALLRLGPDFYLEVIAVNPAAPKPDRPRWFGMDALHAGSPPRLAGWVVRTNNIAAAVAASPVDVGPVESMSRGTLNWLITIPADGRFPLDGVMPTLIEWHTPSHPAANLQESACTLHRLQGFHAQAVDIMRSLALIGLQDDILISAPAAGQAPYLRAEIHTPDGLRVLG